MKSLFSGLTALSLRFRAVTLALVILLSIAGVYAVTQLKQELIPSVEFPQTIILAQATGMTSDQVLNVLTNRIETALDGVEEVVNLESSTTGTFGAVITARNNFGVNQERLRGNIQAAINTVWLPLRRIAPPQGETADAFAARLLGDLSPDVLIYLQQGDSNFLFQLSPEVWAALSPETTQTLLAYLATQTKDVNSSDALRLLVEQEIVPALENIDLVASVAVSGGQILPGEGEVAPTAAPIADLEAPSRLLDLTPEVWAVVSAKVEGLDALDQSAVDTLSAVSVTLPEGVPALPESWQMDRFKDARDLREMRTLTRTVGALFNSFVDSGEIVGALGQTDDLTVADINQLLAVDPTLVQYFEAEQLVSLSDEVFAALPAEYIASLDGFTRDQLAAKSLAASIQGEAAEIAPVDLPQPWRIQPPQLISFSFDDLPLASFSISGTGAPLPVDEANPSGAEAAAGTEEQPVAVAETPVVQEVPEGPALPLVFNLLGGFIGLELNTADDLINIQLPEDMAAQFGGSTLRAADLLNFLLLLDNPDALPEGSPAITIPGGAAGVIRQLSPEVITFVAEYDPTFLPSLSADAVSAFSLDVLLTVPGVEIPLDSVWNTLSDQPQFANSPLRTAQDLVETGNGQPSSVLNTINASVPAQFAGYEVRLFDSLTPTLINYFTALEPDFFANLDAAVVAKFAPAVLAELPEDVLSALPADTATALRSIASGETPSAAAQLAELYTSDVPPADPNAPALNSEWQFIGDFLGVELDSADDLFRFFPSATGFINNLFNTAQGASFAPGLLGGTSPEAISYMVGRDANFLNDLSIEALQLLPADVVASLPADVQERIASGALPFIPTNAVTRVNGNSSLSITVYKTDDANNVEAYHIVEDLLHELDVENENISVTVAFEQASFVEESISGVAREGGLGAIFAVIVILIFLSSGHWSRRPRAIVGGIMIALFLGGLFLVVQGNLAAAGNDFGRAFDKTDVVVRVLLIGAGVGFAIMLFPGKLPHPAWRSTLVTGVSIPLSVLMALAFMYWVPPIVHTTLLPLADTSSLATFMLRLFPASITLNIMTLSGLTVAIGRVVDDSIVVLENIFRHLQEGEDKTHALIEGTRDVSVAIFAATVITVVVFLPLGLTGGIIGEFFLPFGLAVTYSLMSSFIVAITVVPVVAYLLLDRNEIADDENSFLERLYAPALHWALANGRNSVIVFGAAAISLVIGLGLFATRPLAFLPSFGEPQIAVSVNLPAGTKIADTNALVVEFENGSQQHSPPTKSSTSQTIIGGGGGLESLIPRRVQCQRKRRHDHHWRRTSR